MTQTISSRNGPYISDLHITSGSFRAGTEDQPGEITDGIINLYSDNRPEWSITDEPGNVIFNNCHMIMELPLTDSPEDLFLKLQGHSQRRVKKKIPNDFTGGSLTEDMFNTWEDA